MTTDKRPKRTRAASVQLSAGELKVLLANATRDAMAAIVERGIRHVIVHEVREILRAELQPHVELFDQARASLLEQQRLVERTLSDTNDRIDRIDELYLSQLPKVAAKPKRKKARR